MNQILDKYLPINAVKPCFELIKQYKVYLKIVNQRTTRHGDYRRLPGGQHQITVNGGKNKYRFLITLIHEIAHLVAFEKYGQRIKPHGEEWKYTFKILMLPFIRPDIFPSQLLAIVAHHFKNPKASSDTDANLTLALKEYDEITDRTYIFEVPLGGRFRLPDGRIFIRGQKKIKRYLCKEEGTGKFYVFQPHTEVEPL